MWIVDILVSIEDDSNHRSFLLLLDVPSLAMSGLDEIEIVSILGMFVSSSLRLIIREWVGAATSCYYKNHHRLIRIIKNLKQSRK